MDKEWRLTGLDASLDAQADINVGDDSRFGVEILIKETGNVEVFGSVDAASGRRVSRVIVTEGYR